MSGGKTCNKFGYHKEHLKITAQTHSHRTAGMKQTQLVNMAPFTTSSSGNTTKNSRVSPIMCIVSNTRTTKKSEKEDRRHDLNTQILADLNAVPKILRHLV